MYICEMLTSIRSLLDRAYDHFIPAALEEPLDEYYRAQALVLVSLVSAVILVLFDILRFMLQGFDAYPVLVLALIGLILLSPSVLRRTASVETAGLFLTTTGTIGIFLSSLIDGGILSPSVFALLLMPLFAIFFGSLVRGLVATGVVVASLVLLCLATLNGWGRPVPFDDVTYTWLFAAAALSLMVVLVCIAYLYMGWQKNINEGLRAASQAKDDFLSGMSHELRTPLNSIMGFSDILLHEYAGPLNEQQKQNLQLIYSSGEHLTELVEDLVNVTNIEAGKITLEPSRHDIVALVRSCVSTFEVEASEKHIQFEISVGDVPETVSVDDTRIRQILANLLSNAIKFSPEGGAIDVRLERNGPILEVSVTDSGMGVPAEHSDTIFEKFFQVESALAGKTVGSGLGLYIARRLAELHGGRLRHEDRNDGGPGATFVLMLPI